jgi:hypothetical protein
MNDERWKVGIIATSLKYLPSNVHGGGYGKVHMAGFCFADKQLNHWKYMCFCLSRHGRCHVMYTRQETASGYLRKEYIMKQRMTSLAVLTAFAVVAGAAMAEPVKLSKAQMDKVVAGAITPVQINGGGNTPNGNANGVPTTNVNPAGSAPPGQNK